MAVALHSNGVLSSEAIDALAAQTNEPSWVTELRKQALKQHMDLPWPHPSDDIWRRTDVSLLDPSKGFALAPPSLLQGARLGDDQLKDLTVPLAGEHLITRVNGAWLSNPQIDGVRIIDLSQAARENPDAIRPLLEAGGLSDAEQKLLTLNRAFHHDDVVVQVPANKAFDRPIRLVHVLTPGPQQIVFPSTFITVGSGSAVTIIDEYVGVDGEISDGAHIVNSHIELDLAPGAKVHYVRVQRWSKQAREFLLSRVSLAQDAELTMANLNIGSSLSKAHIVSRFIGERASSKLYGFVFGHGDQHIDQHTLQDHQAAHTFSDLQFRAALQDRSRMVYTGLIRIGKAAMQTDAYQSNHNLLLSRQAQAETIPMLEILADDVRCKHGASVGPIDEEQIFYLGSRGIPRSAAERLIVMGFIEPIVEQVPFEPLQERLRETIEGELREEDAEPAPAAAGAR